eukprot:m.206420 g.206420  ORF g.206420 m.206420 type:complete len:735 (-) comp13756_c0_seq1:5683-7887(-)
MIRQLFPLRQCVSLSSALNCTALRSLSVSSVFLEETSVSNIRNVGISAHIDSGKTTLTERILFYTGRIKEMHEVRGKDDVGATMDSMELEKEKGITIASAATYTTWKDYNINIIDTPGHVDFTIEVERALRVLDGAVLVLCSVGGVQSQTITVDRQMRRYNVPRIAFINKSDRPGANPFGVISQLKSKLSLNTAAVQIPIGLEDKMTGVADLVRKKAYTFVGNQGTSVEEGPVPEELSDLFEEKRHDLIAALADVDEDIADLYLMEEDPDEDTLVAAIRRCTIAQKFVPVFIGTALKNIGVQPMLDGVVDYLPAPDECENVALDATDESNKVVMDSIDHSKPFVGLAFKLERGQFGQLTYLRTYQGTLRKGDFIFNSRDNKKVKVPRLVRMHSDSMEDVQEVRAGEICAMFGLDCASGDTFTDGQIKLTMESMYVPEPVISLAIKPKNSKDLEAFSKAINRFQKQDPTFKVHLDPNSKETIISGMGELHLEIYKEMMERDFNCPTVTGKPKVAFRETIEQPAKFDYLHKKQSGGSGQYARVIGEIVPMTGDESGKIKFVDETVGTNIPKTYVPSIQKGFEEACEKSAMTGHPAVGMKFILRDGVTHAVDSSEMAFRLAAIGAVRQAFETASPCVTQPVMTVEINAPDEYQGGIIGDLNKRKGTILDSETSENNVTIKAEVPLNDMFGYDSDLRSNTQGKGEFTMEYARHEKAPANLQNDLIKEYKEELAGGKKK